MPELPEVETIVIGLSTKLIGYEVSSFRLSFPRLLKNNRVQILNKFIGSRILGLRRRGKMILMDFDNDLTLLFHLKMTGQFFISPSDEPHDKHTHFALAFRNQMKELRFRDVRKFGSILCFQTSQTLKFDGLGPEPLEISFPRFRFLFQARKARLKGLLLNQNFIAGIGNIYADEILFEAKLHPLTSVPMLKEEDYKKLWEAMRLVLRRALKHKGTSIRDFKDAEGREGNFQNYLQVYGRKSLPCLRCGEIIERLRFNGRSSHFCPICQKKRRETP